MNKYKRSVDSGITKVIIDTERSKVPETKHSLDTQPEQTAGPLAVTVLPVELIDAIHDGKLPAKEKEIGRAHV
jgi:hypothetical protein